MPAFINIWAVLISMVLSVILGFIWYGPLFGKKWMALTGIVMPTDRKPAMSDMIKPVILSMIGAFFMIFTLSSAIAFHNAYYGTSGLMSALSMAFLLWLGFVVPVYFNLSGWEGKAWTLFFIHTGYWLVFLLIANILSSRGYTSSFFTSKDSRSQFLKRARKSDIVFLAISTRDTGKVALGYIQRTLDIGKPVVTCEKGSLAYHFGKLRPHLSRIGYTATVGGGSGMLNLFSFPHFQLEQVVGIVNGTQNFLFSECALGRDPYQVLADSKNLGLCEPGGNGLADIVNGEIKDTVLKATIAFNCSGVSSKVLRASEFSEIRIFEGEILRLLAQRTLRFVASISTKPNTAMSNWLFNCLHVRKAGWHIQVGVAHMSSLPFQTFPKREQNALIIRDSVGLTQITGMGAGPIPTAATMVMDAEKLLQ